jgi:NAD-reducing hydrogenase small subunit
MSFLDLDEFLFDLAGLVEVVYSPIIDIKEYPENVDLCLIEGAVANNENAEMVHRIRRHTRILLSFGDCAITGNVTAMRNFLGSPEPALRRAYIEGADINPHIPSAPGLLPVLLPRVLPVHALVPVEHHLPGCPPSAERIKAIVTQLLEGKTPRLTPPQIKFG